MIEVILNDRLGRKIRVKCNPDDTVGDLKKLVAAQCGELHVTSVALMTAEITTKMLQGGDSKLGVSGVAAYSRYSYCSDQLR